MKKTYKRLVKWFLSIVRGDQELMIEATHSFETGNCLWTQLNPHSFVIFNDYFGASIGFQLSLLSAPMQVSPSRKGSKCNVPLSSGKWKAWKASASALSAAGWDQLALKQPWENPACSMPRNIVAPGHPGFSPSSLPDTFLWRLADIVWTYMPLKCDIHPSRTVKDVLFLECSKVKGRIRKKGN